MKRFDKFIYIVPLGAIGGYLYLGPFGTIIGGVIGLLYAIFSYDN